MFCGLVWYSPSFRQALFLSGTNACNIIAWTIYLKWGWVPSLYSRMVCNIIALLCHVTDALQPVAIALCCGSSAAISRMHDCWIESLGRCWQLETRPRCKSFWSTAPTSCQPLQVYFGAITQFFFTIGQWATNRLIGLAFFFFLVTEGLSCCPKPQNQMTNEGHKRMRDETRQSILNERVQKVSRGLRE